MTAKLVLVLGYLSLIAVTLVSWPVFREVCTGFASFGTVPLRRTRLSWSDTSLFKNGRARRCTA